MRRQTVWNAEMDGRLRSLRRDGATWDRLAVEMGLSRDTVLERARKLGARAKDTMAMAKAEPPGEPRDRPARAPGHPATWQMLTAGTSLDGATYPFRVFL